MKKIIVLLMGLPLFGLAQAPAEKGIFFENSLTWEQVKQKAKAENKYIFVDCYATWCGPCKRMDREVYTNDTVGNFMNQSFISVKVQMDTSKQDNQAIKKKYSEAKEIQDSYNVHAYPTFLYLTPTLQVAYKELGYKDPKEFIQIGKTAKNPMTLANYELLEKYQEGKLNHSSLGDLARFVDKVLGDKKFAKQIATDYINSASRNELLSYDNILLVLNIAQNRKMADSLTVEYKTNYLDKLNEDEACTRENFTILNIFSHKMVNSSDKFFHLCYTQPKRVNEVMKWLGDTAYAEFVVQIVVSREELANKLFIEGNPITRNPNWEQYLRIMKAKYPNADVNYFLSQYRIGFYKKIGDWKQWAQYFGQKISSTKYKQGDGFWEINLPVWSAFLKCNDKDVLTKMLEWSDLSIQVDQPTSDVQCLDTRANLLYKLGRVQEAIEQEQNAVEVAKELEKKNGRNLTNIINGYLDVIEKMKRREPTYVEEGAIWDAQTLPKR